MIHARNTARQLLTASELALFDAAPRATARRRAAGTGAVKTSVQRSGPGATPRRSSAAQAQLEAAKLHGDPAREMRARKRPLRAVPGAQPQAEPAKHHGDPIRVVRESSRPRRP